MNNLVIDPFQESDAREADTAARTRPLAKESGNINTIAIENASGSIQFLNPTNSEAKPISTQGKVPSPLFNRSAPRYIQKREQPRHRAILELAASGHLMTEIAKTLNVSVALVQDVLRQPRAQGELVAQIHDNFGTDREVVELIKESVIKAVETTIEIMEDDTAKKSDRLAAANLLLERRYGKANTPINRGTDVDLNNLPDSELAKMLPNN